MWSLNLNWFNAHVEFNGTTGVRYRSERVFVKLWFDACIYCSMETDTPISRYVKEKEKNVCISYGTKILNSGFLIKIYSVRGIVRFHSELIGQNIKAACFLPKCKSNVNHGVRLSAHWQSQANGNVFVLNNLVLANRLSFHSSVLVFFLFFWCVLI